MPMPMLAASAMRPARAGLPPAAAAAPSCAIANSGDTSSIVAAALITIPSLRTMSEPPCISPEEMVGKINRQHQGCQNKKGSQERPHVSHPLGAQTEPLVIDECDQAERKGQIRICRRRLHPGNEPEQIAPKNEQEKAADKWH